jgi:hypothetical protein
MKKFSIAILAVFLLLQTGLTQAQESKSVSIKSSTVVENFEDFSSGQDVENSVLFDIPVWMVGFEIDGQQINDGIELLIRGEGEKDWMNIDLESEQAEVVDTMNIEPIAMNNITQKIDYIIRAIDSEVVLNKIEFVGIDPYDYEGVVQSFAKVQSRYQKSDRLSIINRDEWGADESLMFWDDDMEHKPIKQIIIHHTAGNDNSPLDPAAVMRGIYYYHTVTNAWGDIGYNYVIDQYGNVYEGRKGGLGVVAAHAYGSNSGSVGISVLGNYVDVTPSSNSIDGLVNTIAYVSYQTGLKLDGKVKANNKTIDVISGHRDVQATACPGEKFYQMLPQIRQKAQTLVNGVGKKQYEARLISDTALEMTLTDGEEQEIKLEYQNIGSGAWLNGTDDVVLAAIDPINRASGFAGSDWKNNSTIGEAMKYTIMPNETGIFSLKLKGNSSTGYYNEKFGLIYAGEVIPGTEFSVGINNLGIKIDKNYQNQYGISAKRYRYEYLGNDKIMAIQGGKTEVSIKLKNTGDNIWYKSGLFPLHLGTVNSQDRNSGFYDTESWLTPNRIEFTSEKVIPGEVGIFKFTIKGDVTNGDYKESFRPVLENISWIDGSDITLDISLDSIKNSAELVAKSDQIPYMIAGEITKVWMDIKNTGNQAWVKDDKNEITIGTSKSKDRTSDFYNMQYWTTANRAAEMRVEEVKPGETIRMELVLQAPNKKGSYQECFAPVIDENIWMDNAEACWDLSVQN